RERAQRIDGVRGVVREQRRPEAQDDNETEDRAADDQRRAAAQPALTAPRPRLEVLEQQRAGVHGGAHSRTTRGSSDACTTSVMTSTATTRNAKISVTPCTTG